MSSVDPTVRVLFSFFLFGFGHIRMFLFSCVLVSSCSRVQLKEEKRFLVEKISKLWTVNFYSSALPILFILKILLSEQNRIFQRQNFDIFWLFLIKLVEFLLPWEHTWVFFQVFISACMNISEIEYWGGTKTAKKSWILWSDMAKKLNLAIKMKCVKSRWKNVELFLWLNASEVSHGAFTRN